MPSLKAGFASPTAAHIFQRGIKAGNSMAFRLRLFSFVVGGKDIAGKECAVIACCEEDDMSVFDGVRVN